MTDNTFNIIKSSIKAEASFKIYTISEDSADSMYEKSSINTYYLLNVKCACKQINGHYSARRNYNTSIISIITYLYPSLLKSMGLSKVKLTKPFTLTWNWMICEPVIFIFLDKMIHYYVASSKTFFYNNYQADVGIIIIAATAVFQFHISVSRAFFCLFVSCTSWELSRPTFPDLELPLEQCLVLVIQSILIK